MPLPCSTACIPCLQGVLHPAWSQCGLALLDLGAITVTPQRLAPGCPSISSVSLGVLCVILLPALVVFLIPVFPILSGLNIALICKTKEFWKSRKIIKIQSQHQTSFSSDFWAPLVLFVMAAWMFPVLGCISSSSPMPACHLCATVEHHAGVHHAVVCHAGTCHASIKHGLQLSRGMAKLC